MKLPSMYLCDRCKFTEAIVVSMVPETEFRDLCYDCWRKVSPHLFDDKEVCFG